MGLLHDLGYARVRHYSGGLQEWAERGESFESGVAIDGRVAPPPGSRAAARDRTGAAGRVRRAFNVLVDAAGHRSIAGLLMIWLYVTVGFGLAYWAAAAQASGGLLHDGARAAMDGPGLLSALYFSFVTALSIGYGDVIPAGWFRGLAVVEGALGLLVFGAIVSKLVSQRQEDLLDETHRMAFEDRLGRVRTNLHLVLSDLQTIAAMCADAATPQERILPRLESAVAIFEGELRAVHDLLYRPQIVPDEGALESILANLAANLQELGDLLLCARPGKEPSATLASNLRSVRDLADGICGDCVPRAHAPHLRTWMDRIQEHGRRLTPAAGTASSGRTAFPS